jgi:hypothetical protein
VSDACGVYPLQKTPVLFAALIEAHLELIANPVVRRCALRPAPDDTCRTGMNAIPTHVLPSRPPDFNIPLAAQDAAATRQIEIHAPRSWRARFF